MKIAIEGNIGCGKSTVISRLCQETRLPIFLEPVEDWKEWLTIFYKDPAKYGFAFNVNVLMTFNNWSNNSFPAIYERSPLSNRFVFAELQRDHGKMTILEMSLFHDLYKKLGWTPNTIIYIKTDPTTCYERMMKRGRECESQVSLEYLQDVHKKYEELINRYSNTLMTNMIIIDGNRTHDEVYADVYKVVSALTKTG